jgi:mycothiol synthase
VWRAKEATVVVHPEHQGRGIGTGLVEWVERRAREQITAGAAAGKLVQHVLGGHSPARALLERHGYREGTYTWRMDMEMGEPPPEPDWPPGIGVRTFDPDRDAAEVHELVQRAFAEGWEHEDVPFDEWKNFMMGRDTFDPSLWFLAVDGDRIVGTALSPSYPDIAWIRQVAVRREYRGRGIGRALLLHAMREFYRRGWRRAGLTVEAENRTGARRLYESVGMRTRYEFIHMEKPLA